MWRQPQWVSMITYIESPTLEMTLRATCYWPHVMEAIEPYAPGAVEIKINLCDEKGTPVGLAKYYVRESDRHQAEIEASATLDLGGVLNMPAKLGLAYHGGRWYSYRHAPYGVGTRLNPLVPGRDFAHTPSGGRWPHGTRLSIAPHHIPPMLVGHIREEMYLGCSFGAKKKSHRVDLFTELPIKFHGDIACQIDKPYMGTSETPIIRDPIQGAQQALLILGYDLGRWGADGIWGDASQESLDAWAVAEGVCPTWPGRIHPTDSEVTYKVRDTARRAQA